MALFGNQFALPLIWFSSLHSCGCVSLSSLIWSAVLLERLRHAFQVLVFISVSRHPSNGGFVVYGLDSDLIWTACFLGSLLLSILQSETCPMSVCFVILCPVSLSLSHLACCAGFCNCHHDGWSLFHQWLQSLLGNETNIVGSMSRTRSLMIVKKDQYKHTKEYWDLQ